MTNIANKKRRTRISSNNTNTTPQLVCRYEAFSHMKVEELKPSSKPMSAYTYFRIMKYQASIKKLRNSTERRYRKIYGHHSTQIAMAKMWRAMAKLHAEFGSALEDALTAERSII